MPRKGKQKVVFDIPGEVQAAAQTGWVYRDADLQSQEAAAITEEPAPGDTSASASPPGHGAVTLPAVQYAWTVPPPGRLASVRQGIERGIAWCAVPFEIGLTLALSLCADPRMAARRPGTSGRGSGSETGVQR
jgi:hypothetical protein